MSTKLVAEVLDRYHGPDALKLWLLAFAESANDRTRQGWPGRPLLARRTGKSPARVSNIATELEADGVIKRVGGGGRHRGETRYELLPLTPANDSQGSASANSENASQGSVRVRNRGSQGSESGPQGSGISPLPAETPYNPQNPQEPSSLSPRARGRDLRAEFARQGATERETEVIFHEIENDPAIHKPTAYLRAALDNGDGPELIDRARRVLAARDKTTPPREGTTP